MTFIIQKYGFKIPGTNGWQSDFGLKIAVMKKYNTP